MTISHAQLKFSLSGIFYVSVKQVRLTFDAKDPAPSQLQVQQSDWNRTCHSPKLGTHPDGSVLTAQARHRTELSKLSLQ